MGKIYEDTTLDEAVKMLLRDSGIALYSSVDGQGDFDADVELEFTAPTIQLVASTKLDIDSNTIDFGTGSGDITLSFIGATTGILKWRDDEDYFQFEDEVFITGQNAIYYGSTGVKSYSPASGNFIAEASGTATFRGTSTTNIGVIGDTTVGDPTERVFRPHTDKKINLGTSSYWFNEAWLHELHVQQSVSNVSDPPTDAELDSIFGTPASLGRGFIGLIDDNSAEVSGDIWLCVTTDNSWFYLSMTKAT